MSGEEAIPIRFGSPRFTTAPPPAVAIRGLCRGYRCYPTCGRFYDGEGICRINSILGVGNR